jgi:hypothetical protein
MQAHFKALVEAENRFCLYLLSIEKHSKFQDNKGVEKKSL